MSKNRIQILSMLAEGEISVKEAEKLLVRMKRNRYGKNAAIIGEVITDHPGKVIMTTSLGASRIVDMLTGDLLPRIC